MGPRFFCAHELVSKEWCRNLVRRMEESEYDENKKVNITTQPIFWVAMALVVFNLGLFFWSTTRNSYSEEKEESPVEQLEVPLPE